MNSWSRRRRSGVLACAVFLLAGGTLVWWRGSQEDAMPIPARVCNDHIPGTQVARLVPDPRAGFEELPTDFPGRADGEPSSCEILIGTADVDVSVQYPGADGARASVQRAEPYFAELGPVWGVYVPIGGNLVTYVPCPSGSDPEAVLKVLVGSQPAEWSAADSRAPTRAIEELAHFSAFATRTLAKHYHCPTGADIPVGPVRIRGLGR